MPNKNGKIQAETQEINERPQKIETRLTACVDLKVDNGIKATCEKNDKSYAEVMAVQPKEARYAHTRAPTKTMCDMDLNIRKSIGIQGVPEYPEKSETESLVPTTDVLNGILE